MSKKNATQFNFRLMRAVIAPPRFKPSHSKRLFGRDAFFAGGMDAPLSLQDKKVIEKEIQKRHEQSMADLLNLSMKLKSDLNY